MSVCSRGQTTFFAASSDEIQENMETKRGATLYCMASETSGAGKRMMKAIPEQVRVLGPGQQLTLLPFPIAAC